MIYEYKFAKLDVEGKGGQKVVDLGKQGFRVIHIYNGHVGSGGSHGNSPYALLERITDSASKTYDELRKEDP